MTEEQDTTPAHAYQEYYVPAIFEPLADFVFELAAPAPGDRVVDIACGTGVAARRAAERTGPGGRVVGVDINPAMIRVARAQAAPAGARVEWRQGDATALDLPDRAFDLTYCQQGLQFFADRRAGLATLRRLLADDGRAVIAVWEGLERHPLFAALVDAEVPHLAELGVDVTREEAAAPFSLGDAAELRALLTGVGFRDVEIVRRSVQARFATPERFVERLELAYAAVIPQFVQNPEAFASFVDTVAREMKPVVERHRDGDRVVVPMHTHIAVARA